jgi:CheY-like chemotaxis protein
MARIVLIDDDPDFIGLVAELLRDHGRDVVTCDEDTEAVSCVQASDPDLVILDVRMSTRESGWEILESLQNDPSTAEIPVIVCSAAIDDLEARSGWMAENGVTPLPKPFDIDDLLSMVNSLLAERPPHPSRNGTANGTES